MIDKGIRDYQQLPSLCTVAHSPLKKIREGALWLEEGAFLHVRLQLQCKEKSSPNSRFQQIRFSPYWKMPSLSGGGGGLKMECPIKFSLGMELISVQLMADHWLFKSFLGGTPHIKGVGMLIGNFELNP